MKNRRRRREMIVRASRVIDIVGTRADRRSRSFSFPVPGGSFSFSFSLRHAYLGLSVCPSIPSSLISRESFVRERTPAAASVAQSMCFRVTGLFAPATIGKSHGQSVDPVSPLIARKTASSETVQTR